MTFVGSLIAIPWFLVRIPEDYFSPRQADERRQRRAGHPVWRWLAPILKNLAGVVFILAGVAMLVLPGQGLLTIVVGVLLTDFPGKRRLERRLVTQRHVLAAINAIRRRSGRPPLRV